MKEPYCLVLRFKDNSISNLDYHAHLYINEKEIYIRIIDTNENSDIDRRFMISENALSLFEENFEIIKSEYDLVFDKSLICKVTSLSREINHSYFTIYLTNICVIMPNIHKEGIDEGKAILNGNGLKIVNHFYSYFTNNENKNSFKISRMNGMSDYYVINNLEFRPELDFDSDERRNSEKFTINRIPTISFNFKNIDYKTAKENIDVACKFLSFCYGIRIQYHKLIYRTSDSIFIYWNNEKVNDNYVSKISTIFSFLSENYRIEKILKTNWHINYLNNRSKFDKAIDNFLHSREVENSSKYLLLFNIIELFNQNQIEEKFEVNNLKAQNLKSALDLLEKTLVNKNDIELFRDKWEGLINKIYTKPLKSPLEETLKSNGICSENFGFSFSELKKVRDKITHGSVNSIRDEKLQEYIYAIRNICVSLILSQLGFRDEIKINR